MAYKLLETLYYSDRDGYELEYKRRFTDEKTVRIGLDIHGNPAFYLPTPDIYEMVIDIQKNTRRIAQVKAQLPPIAIDQFITRCLIDEIVVTNDIEGVSSTRREISEILGRLSKEDKKNRFEGLVRKYVTLWKNPQISLLTSQDVRDLYDDIVLAEVIREDPNDKPDGRIFRAGTVQLSSPRMEIIYSGVYPEERIITLMDAALRYLNYNMDEALFRIAVFHYLLGYIHPFYNGNGRLSRFISSWLIAGELDPIMAYRLSYTIKENISKYSKAFVICNDEKNRGDLTPFLEMFLSVLKQSSVSLLQALTERADRLQHYRNRISRLPSADQKYMHSVYDLLIQAELFSENGITAEELSKALSVSEPTAKKSLDLVRREGLLKEMKSSRKKYYGIELERVSSLF